jgi:hypothetical protein
MTPVPEQDNPIQRTTRTFARYNQKVTRTHAMPFGYAHDPRPRDWDSSPGEYGSDGGEDHRDRRVCAGSAPVECVPVSAWWAVSPRDAKAHSLRLSDHSPVLQTRCGHALPAGVVAHDRLPGWQWCVPCMVAHLMPEPVSAGKTPAGRRLNPAPFSVPGGQPVPAPSPPPGALPGGSARAGWR